MGQLMSATMCFEILEHIRIHRMFTMSFARAIQEKRIVDYTIWLPHLLFSQENNEYKGVDITIPPEFKQYDSDLTAKSLYHAVCMLKTGSRKCIVYLPNQEECDSYMKIVADVFLNYHGIDVWTHKIISSTTSQERTRILDEFQHTDSSMKMYILCSVRILDEAVNIPKCDSVFITKVGEHSSDIRFFQRISRSSTVDKENPNKHNNIFLWSEGLESCVDALSRLKDADPEFHKKLRVADCMYDSSHQPNRVKSIHVENNDTAKKLSIA